MVFDCDVCGKQFSRPDSLQRHRKGWCVKQEMLCHLCGKVYRTDGGLTRHMCVQHNAPKRAAATTTTTTATSSTPTVKRAKLNANPSTSDAVVCDISIPRHAFPSHLRSQKHKENSQTQLEDGVVILRQAFKTRIVAYKITAPSETTGVKNFLCAVKAKTVALVTAEQEKYRAVKFNVELFALYVLPTKEVEELKSFNTKNATVTPGSNIEQLYDDLATIVEQKASEFEERDSGSAVRRVTHLEININKFKPL